MMEVKYGNDTHTNSFSSQDLKSLYKNAHHSPSSFFRSYKHYILHCGNILRSSSSGLTSTTSSIASTFSDPVPSHGDNGKYSSIHEHSRETDMTAPQNGPALLIYRSNNDEWFAAVANTSTKYAFTDYNGVVYFSRAMSIGMPEDVDAIIQAGLVFKGSDLDAPAIVADLLQTTSSVSYEAVVIYVVPEEGAFLGEFMVEAGEALLVLVGMAFRAQAMGNDDETVNPLLATDEGPNQSASPLDAMKTSMMRMPVRNRRIRTMADSPDFSIVCSNLLNGAVQADFNLIGKSWPDNSWPVRLITTPSAKLASNGRETLSWLQHLSDIALGPYDAFLIWQNARTGTWFGVMNHVPLQEYHAGNAPSYKVSWSGGGNNQAEWIWPVSDTSSSWTFPKELGYKVRVDPTAGGQSLLLSVTVSALD
ncbi:uncharacterized protein LTR77_003154 [Saxophila tyrrhenica]|uniref:Uncharacterized protein n=1 Tax=Saxophila tyrrhenica TaxID=1690608 RepID=A0AAV9PK49_9PEZI|nr:hypothetical protein LTR77_003154 [Saxophila tyrrhenica]